MIFRAGRCGIVVHWPQTDSCSASWGEASEGWRCWSRRRRSDRWRRRCGRETLSSGRCSPNTTRDPEDLNTRITRLDQRHFLSVFPTYFRDITWKATYRWSDPRSRLRGQRQGTDVWFLCQRQDSRSPASCSSARNTCSSARCSCMCSFSWLHLTTQQATQYLLFIKFRIRGAKKMYLKVEDLRWATFVVIILFFHQLLFSLQSDLCRWHWSVFTPVTFVRSDLVHRDAAAVGEGEHDFRDAVVAQPPPGIAIPLVLSLGHHGSHGSQERSVRVYQQSLLLRIALHVHTVGGVRFPEAGKQRSVLIFALICVSLNPKCSYLFIQAYITPTNSYKS